MEGAYRLTEKGEKMREYVNSLDKEGQFSPIPREASMKELALVTADPYAIRILKTLKQGKKRSGEMIQEVYERLEASVSLNKGNLEEILQQDKSSDEKVEEIKRKLEKKEKRIEENRKEIIKKLLEDLEEAGLVTRIS